jgi:hypothetical protein
VRFASSHAGYYSYSYSYYNYSSGSGGAIAGAVIGVLFFIGLCCGGIYFFWYAAGNNNRQNNRAFNGANAAAYVPPGGALEVNARAQASVRSHALFFSTTPSPTEIVKHH